MEKQIKYKTIKVGELVGFADEVIGRANPGDFIPISYQRAVAHANNPAAEPDDDALLVAIDDDGDVVGYFGILPILLCWKNQIEKVHWFTTWNISSKVRGQGVGTKLMEYALSLEKDYLIVGSIYARRVCREYGFFERVFRYYWLDMTGKERLNPLIWFRRGLRKIRNTISVPDSAFPIQSKASRMLDHLFSPYSKRWYYHRLSQSLDEVLDGLSFEDVPQVLDVGTNKRTTRPELYRSTEVINWMLQYPWVVPPGESRTENMDYYFSDVRPLFRMVAFQIHDKSGENLGYAVYQVSGKPTHIMVKVLDWKINHANSERIVLALAVQLGEQYQADTLELPYHVGKAVPSSMVKLVLLHEKERVYQCHPKSTDSPLAKAWPELQFKLVDGDMPFS